MIRAGHGEQLSAALGGCVECGTGRRSWGRLCGDCYRAEHGIVLVAPEPPPVVVVVVERVPAPRRKAAPRPNRDRRAERMAYRRHVLGLPDDAPEAEIMAAWSTRPTTQRRNRKASARRCSWPGCDRPHAMRGFCYRDSRRLPRLGVDGSDPAALPALWAAHLDALGDVFAANGAKRKGTKWRRNPTA